MKNVVFFGSAKYFSAQVLEKLLNANCQVQAVVTTPDQPSGRHLKLTPTPVKVLAEKHAIPVHTSPLIPLLNSGEGKPQQGEVIGLVAAYGRIIPQSVIDTFGGRIYNIHPSLLPKYRGPSPLQQQILDGVTETGATIIQLDAQMDHGPIVAQVKDTILPNDTWITLGNRLFESGANWFTTSPQSPLLSKERGAEGEERYVPQDHNQATYTKKLTRQDGYIEPITEDRILNIKKRAFFGWPGVWTIDLDGQRQKLS